MDCMQPYENHDAGPSALPPSSSNPNRDSSSDSFQPSIQLRDKLKELADRRIDISSIEFVNGAPEIRGGYATVSRAVLVSPSSGQDRTGPSNPATRDGLDLPGPAGDISRRRKNVAVKKMNSSDDQERVLGSTLREAELLVGLSHENIIKLEGFVEDSSKAVLWLVFLWAENGTLKEFIASADWEIPERIWLIYDVARGVEYLHSRQPPIRHGDLKCINIVVNSECRAVITDFGCARGLVAQDTEKQLGQVENNPQALAAPSLEAAFYGSTNTISITLTGNEYTLRWAAPELLMEGRASLKNDVWALGWVAYEVMTNSIPFQDVVHDTIVILRVVQGDLPSITDNVRMSLIQALCSLMLGCWSIDPHKRPTAEEFRSSTKWMPRVRPTPIRTADTAASRARSPELLMKLGDLYRRQGEYENASDFFTKALSSYRDVGDSEGMAMALVELAQVHRHRNEYRQAVTFYSRALKIRTDIGDRQGRADALQGLADVHRLRDEYSKAVEFYSEALQIRTEIGDKRGSSYALWGLADVHRLRSEYAQAVTFYSQALQIRTDISDRHGRADSLYGLAQVHRVRKEYSQAVEFYSEALQIRTDLGDKQGRADALWGLAEVHRGQTEYGQAVTFYSEALQIRTEIGDRQGRAETLQGLAGVHRLRGEYSKAEKFYSEALEISIKIGDRYGRAFTLAGLAAVYRDQRDYGTAIRLYSEAAEVWEQIGHAQGAARASAQAAELRLELSKREEST